MDDWERKLPVQLSRVFEFQTAGMKPPNRVIFGFGAIDQLGAEAAKLGKGRAMVVSDETLRRAGTLERTASILAASGFEVDTFPAVEAEPHVETAEALCARCLQKEPAVIVGLGGGSVMDVTKLVAQAARRRRSPRDYMEGKIAADGPGIPMILAPTTAGTGSEVSPYLVIKVGERKRFIGSGYFYPDIAVVDPALCLTMPPFVTATTGIDVMAHAIEGMMHKNANLLSDSLCLAGIEMVGRFLRRVVADGGDLEGRYTMSMASTVSMMGMAMSGGLYSHSASFVIGQYKPTAHGLGCGLGLPYLMNFNLPVLGGKLARIALALGEPTWKYSELKAGRKAVQAVAQLIQDVGLPVTLREYGIDEKDLEAMADTMIALYPRPMNARPMGKAEALRYWQDMWSGRL